jgi:hypothetical protein
MSLNIIYVCHVSPSQGHLQATHSEGTYCISEHSAAGSVKIGTVVTVLRSPPQRLSFFASGVRLSPLYCGHCWPIVPAPDDR